MATGDGEGEPGTAIRRSHNGRAPQGETQMAADLRNQVVVITGASSGIGRAARSEAALAVAVAQRDAGRIAQAV